MAKRTYNKLQNTVQKTKDQVTYHFSYFVEQNVLT